MKLAKCRWLFSACLNSLLYLNVLTIMKANNNEKFKYFCIAVSSQAPGQMPAALATFSCFPRLWDVRARCSRRCGGI